MHKEGINLHFLGELRKVVVDEDFKKRILQEILSRTLNKRLSEMLRRKTTGTLSETPYIETAINFLNLVNGKLPNSNEFWGDIKLKEEVNKRFPNTLSKFLH
jgi:hypothetical protein